MVPDTEDVENIKQQKVALLKKQLEEQKTQQDQAMQAEAQLNSVMQRLVDDEGRARLANVKLVNKTLYSRAVQTILMLAQSGKLTRKMSNAEVKRLLEMAVSQKKETHIKVMRK